MKYVVFNRRNEVLRIPMGKAMFFESYGNYCYVVFPNNQKVVLPVGLSQVETIIARRIVDDMPTFMRIGKRFYYQYGHGGTGGPHKAATCVVGF